MASGSRRLKRNSQGWVTAVQLLIICIAAVAATTFTVLNAFRWMKFMSHSLTSIETSGGEKSRHQAFLGLDGITNSKSRVAFTADIPIISTASDFPPGAALESETLPGQAGNPSATSAPDVHSPLAGYPPARWQSLEDMPKDVPLLVTISNNHYSDLMLNWVAHARQIGLPHVVTVVDPKVAELCAQHGILYITPTQLQTAANVREDLKGFRKLLSLKSEIPLQLFREYGFQTIAMSDSDSVWLRNPQGLLDMHPTADFFPSTDCLSLKAETELIPDVNRCGHIPGSHDSQAYCAGVFIVRNTSGGVAMLTEWNKRLNNPKAQLEVNNMEIDDQLELNMLLVEDSFPVRSVPEDVRTILLWGGRVQAMPLPVLGAANGHVTFFQHLPRRYKSKPYLVHATFQRHQLAGKKMRLRSEGWWLLDGPEYYNQGDYMAYNSGVKEFVAQQVALRKGRETSLMWQHLIGAAFQLAAFRDAVAIARVLNRTLVLPEFVCYCDQDQVATVLTECRMVGSDLEMPFICPADIFLNPNVLSTENPSFPHRAANFLSSEKVPIMLKQSRAVVRVDLTQGELSKNLQREGNMIGHIRIGMKAPEIEAALAPYHMVRILDWTNLGPGTFGGFGTIQQNSAFDDMIQGVFDYSADWCCGGGDWEHQWKNVQWRYEQPRKLASLGFQELGFWQPPKLGKPAWCDELSGENIEFARLPNHPCMFDDAES